MKKNVIKINCTMGINIGKFLWLHTSSGLISAAALFYSLFFLFRRKWREIIYGD